METTIRDQDLSRLVSVLNEQHARKADLVVPSTHLDYGDGNLFVRQNGDWTTAFIPTRHFEQAISDRLGIPFKYYEKMKQENLQLLDTNVNTWLGKSKKNYFFRGYSANGEPGVARAFLSDRYKVIDNTDVLFSVLGAIKQKGVDVTIQGADITERRMLVRLYSKDVAVHAPELLKKYRPQGKASDVVFAGFEFGNSEVGAGSFFMVPRILVEVCVNGMKVTIDIMRRTHLGAAMEEGVVKWSDETRGRNLDLIVSQTKDSVDAFLAKEYVEGWVEGKRKAAETMIPEPVKAMEQIAKRVGFTDDQKDKVLEHFLRDGDGSAFGVGQAVTRVAQTMTDGDVAYDLEAIADETIRVAMEVAA